MAEQTEKTLYLLDAMALIYRAHFAFSRNPRRTSKGLDTGAIYGFTNTLLEILEKQNPTHIAVAIDSKEPTFRHEMFEPYKAQRDKQPEEIGSAIPYIGQLLEAFQIPLIVKHGFEADDIIGTMAKKAEKEGFKVYMVTIDKDYAQLVSDNIFFYKVPYAGKKETEIWGVKEVCERWQLKRPEQLIDILGLQGDASDNIPGIPGIGEKTAMSLLQKYDSVEGLIANADKLKGKQKEKVKEFAEQGLLSKKLATIVVDMDIEFDAEKLKKEEYDKEKLQKIFAELEFRSLNKRLFGESLNTQTTNRTPATAPTTAGEQGGLFGGAAHSAIPQKAEQEAQVEAHNEHDPVQNIHTAAHNYHLIDTAELRAELIEFLLAQDAYAFDTETDNLEALDANLVGMSFAYRNAEAYYVPIPADREKAIAILEEFRPVFEAENILKIAQNLKYDYQVLSNYGILPKGKLFDTMLAHYVLEPDERHGLDALSLKYLKYEPVKIEELIGKKGKNQGNMRDLKPEQVCDYACEDADLTFRLYEILAPKIKAQKLERLLEEVEIPLVSVLAEMEREGVSIDTEALAQFSKDLENDIAGLEKNIHEAAGETFNIASPKQLGEVLFDRMKLDPKAKRTSKSKQYKTDEKVLLKLVDKHEIIKYILDYRQFQKLKSTYVDALPALIRKEDMRIHTSFNQAVTATGRLSSANPNLQNIPIRTERGREVRKAFIPNAKGHRLLAIDYSQIELRIMASFSKDETMLEAFRQGKDIHSATAAKVFKVPLEEVDSDKRRSAKTANFGIIYGVSAFGLAQQLHIPPKEAGEIIKAYFEEFPAIKQYMDDIIEQARAQEYVETILGRRRYLTQINSRNAMQRGFAERNAINAPIQGSAADIIKIAMVNIQAWLKAEKLQTKMLLQVHDELVFDVPESELELVKPKLIELMENAYTLEVPLRADAGVGMDWLEAH
ncbi:MAG: DNA polymerase I [Bernardetiaceae bacterium]|nr:DNA polymerase I [Bernardetiaceae bacterium]